MLCCTKGTGWCGVYKCMNFSGFKAWYTPDIRLRTSIPPMANPYKVFFVFSDMTFPYDDIAMMKNGNKRGTNNEAVAYTASVIHDHALVCRNSLKLFMILQLRW